MKFIARKDIHLGVALAVLFAITLTGGAIKRPLWIVATVALAAYLVLDKKKLRCPNCGGFENLDRLLYARDHVFHCRHCGDRVHVR